MPTPSGTIITAQDINKELVRSLTTPMNLNEQMVRWLASANGAASASGAALSFNALRGMYAMKLTNSATTSGNSATTYNYTTRAMGTDYSGRTILVSCHLNYNPSQIGSITGVTVGGVAATVYQTSYSDAVGTTVTAIAVVQVAGTSLDVVINMTGAVAISSGIGVFSVHGLASIVPFHQATYSGTLAVATLTLNVPANGKLLAVSTRKMLESITFTLANKVLDTTLFDGQMSAGIDTMLGAQTGRVITITGATATPTSAIALSFA